MLTLNHTALHKLKVHTMESYPEECCGVLLGRSAGATKTVCDIRKVRNADASDRGRKYFINPEDYKSTEEYARTEGLDILGIYHSHPDRPPDPSEFDLECAFPGLSYVIVSVENNIPSSVASWVLHDEPLMFGEEQIEIMDGEFKHPCK